MKKVVFVISGGELGDPVFFRKQVATAALEPLADHEWKMPPILNGPRCFYVQIAGVTAGPTYFASFDYIELPTLNVS